jgi:hypothetical protein
MYDMRLPSAAIRFGGFEVAVPRLLLFDRTVFASAMTWHDL